MKVCIYCTTYNHEQYIRQCLDGFVMQKTDFPFVAIVHDDASTDGTAEIVREFAEKYPDIIIPIYEKENQHRKKGVYIKDIMNRESAKYNPEFIALCEGDDYWTDPYKIQRQADFLDNHPDYSMCSHVVGEYYQEKDMLTHHKIDNEIEYSLIDVASGKHYYQTLSIMYRHPMVTREIREKYWLWQDVVMVYHLLKCGKGFCFKEEMGVYRVHSGGIWSGLQKTAKEAIDFKIRQSIYDAEQTKIAALGLVMCFSRTLNRRWIVKNPSLIIPALKAIGQNFGFDVACSIYLKKMLLSRNVCMDDFVRRYMNCRAQKSGRKQK